MKLSLKTTFVLLTITMTIVICGGASGKMNTGKLDLPKTVGVWNRSDSPRFIHSENIFKYMNGAGELYLGYRFRHLEVFDYTSAGQGNILVELYLWKAPTMRLACFLWIGAVSRYPLTAHLQRYQINILRHPAGHFTVEAC